MSMRDDLIAAVQKMPWMDNGREPPNSHDDADAIVQTVLDAMKLPDVAMIAAYTDAEVNLAVWDGLPAENAWVAMAGVI